MNRLHIGVLMLIPVLAISIGCGKSSVSDDTLGNDVKAKLYSDATTKSANINVAVKDGVVTLTGDVPNNDIELQAVKIANGTAGVQRVSDQLKVNMAAAGNSAAPAGTPQGDNPPPSPYESKSAPGQPTSTQAAPVEPVAPPPSASPASAAPKVATAPAEPVTVTIPAGERVQVRTIDAINSSQANAGQSYRASLDAPLVSRDRVIVPAGAPVSLVVTSARSAGRIKGSSELEVRLASLDYHGRQYRLDSSVIAEQGKARGKQTAVRTGIGVAAGAIIGAIAGGGKGAAIGSAAGGGAGLGYDVFTHGQQVKIPSESVLTFRLEAPLNIEQRK